MDAKWKVLGMLCIAVLLLAFVPASKIILASDVNCPTETPEPTGTEVPRNYSVKAEVSCGMASATVYTDEPGTFKWKFFLDGQWVVDGEEHVTGNTTKTYAWNLCGEHHVQAHAWFQPDQPGQTVTDNVNEPHMKCECPTETPVPTDTPTLPPPTPTTPPQWSFLWDIKQDCGQPQIRVLNVETNPDSVNVYGELYENGVKFAGVKDDDHLTLLGKWNGPEGDLPVDFVGHLAGWAEVKTLDGVLLERKEISQELNCSAPTEAPSPTPTSTTPPPTPTGTLLPTSTQPPETPVPSTPVPPPNTGVGIDLNLGTLVIALCGFLVVLWLGIVVAFWPAVKNYVGGMLSKIKN